MASDPAHETVRAAEERLRSLDAKLYSSIEHGLDKELYRAVYGSVGVSRIPAQHRPALIDLLAARATLYRALKRGSAIPARSPEYDGEVGNEKMAQAIDACLGYLGEARELPPMKHWDEFYPTW